MPRIKRQELLDESHGLSIRKQASLLQVSRHRKYYQPKGEDPFNLYLMKLIDQQYQRTPFFWCAEDDGLSQWVGTATDQ